MHLLFVHNVSTSPSVTSGERNAQAGKYTRKGTRAGSTLADAERVDTRALERQGY
jgi:hypothetical protein